MVEVDLDKFRAQLIACKTVGELNEPRIDKKSYLQSACAQGFVKHVQAVIDRATDLQDAQEVLDCRASDELQQWTPLFFAINSGPNGFPEVTTLLLRAGCDINKRCCDERGIPRCASVRCRCQDQRCQW